MLPSQFAKALVDARALNNVRFGTSRGSGMYRYVDEFVWEAEKAYDTGDEHRIVALKKLCAAGGVLILGDGSRAHVWWLWHDTRPKDLPEDFVRHFEHLAKLAG
ncbi:MAG TPA: hypothetical protein VJB97_00200 [Candidatus Paceibacterota bacterium]